MFLEKPAVDVMMDLSTTTLRVEVPACASSSPSGRLLNLTSFGRLLSS